MASDEIKNISLSYACEKNWNDMKEVSGGRFCDACQHVVHDFTNQSDCEMKKVLVGQTRVCGRFKRSQLATDFLKYAATTVIVASTVAINSCMEDNIIPAVSAGDADKINGTEVQNMEGASLDTTALENYTVGIVFIDLNELEATQKTSTDDGEAPE